MYLFGRLKSPHTQELLQNTILLFSVVLGSENVLLGDTFEFISSYTFSWSKTVQINSK